MGQRASLGSRLRDLGRPSKPPAASRASSQSAKSAKRTRSRKREAGTRFPAALFDADFYVQSYPDVQDSGLDPLAHFAKKGRREGRSPSAGWQMIERAVRLRREMSPQPLRDIINLFPARRRKYLSQTSFWDRLRMVIHPAFYSVQLGSDVELEVDDVFDHFLSRGVFDGLRPSALFHRDWYIEQLDRRGFTPPGEGVDVFLHWLTIGWNKQVIPTPLFDEAFYVARHGVDLSAWMRRRPNDSTFLHFLEHGCYEPGRRPSPVVGQPPAGLTAREAKAQRYPFFLPQMLVLPRGGDGVDLRRSSPLEDAAILMSRRAQRLESDEIRMLVQKAAEIEPLILKPYGPREINLPPLKHSLLNVRNEGEAVRRDLAGTHFDTIVLIPHCRMSGAARIAGTLTHALKAVEPDASVLLLTTDLSDFDRPDWFHNDVTVFDLSRYAAPLTPDQRIRLLLDVVRGLTPNRIINANSRLGWDLFKVFGKQLTTMADLGAYLFTWDLDDRGNKGGYPISYFQWCLGSLDWVVFDNAALRNELVDRYSMSAVLQRKLHVAYTPIDSGNVDHSFVFEERRRQERILRAFWGGRFDRQKRFDVVIEVAEKMPDLEVWAWGKTVLGGLDIDLEALPPNIKLQGVFKEFDDLPVESCDFLLYTAEWEGLPTMLLDAGARGVATVACSVGGVGEVLTEQTGFPVYDPLSSDAYVQAIKQMLSDPSQVTQRARSFRSTVESMCTAEAYSEAIATAMRAR